MFKENSGKGNFANMPQEKEIKSWPKYPYSGEKEIDDTLTGIDEANSQAAKVRKSKVSNQK